MKFILRKIFLVVLFLTVTTAVSQATTLDVNSAPLGNRADSTVRFAYWDDFTQTQVSPPSGTTYTFDGVSDASSNLTGLSLNQGTPHVLNSQGSGLLNPTGGPVSDVYYSSTFPQNWTLNATSSIDITTISFQIKTANVDTSLYNQMFTPTLVGYGAPMFISGTQGTESLQGLATHIIEYRWFGLNIAANTPLTVQFSMAGGSSGKFTRKPVDYISLDVSSVPEPSTYALAGLGLIGVAGLVVSRRRRAAKV